MSETVNKLERFTATILGDANRQSRQILEDVEKERRQRLTQAEQRLKVQMEREVEAGLAQVKKEMGQAVSQTMMEHKRELFAKRAQVVDRISQELRQKLEQWSKTPDYQRWLLRQFQKAMAALPEGREPVRLLCLPQDQAALEQALAGCGRLVQLEPGPDIRLGGLRLECPGCHMAIDCSLDQAFEQTRGHIAEYIGLRLE